MMKKMKLLNLITLLLIFTSCEVFNGSDSNDNDDDRRENTSSTELEVSEVEMPEDRTYSKDATLKFKLVFEEDIEVKGDPRLQIRLDNDVIVYAEYVSGANTSEIDFEYVVKEEDEDLNDGIKVEMINIVSGNLKAKSGKSVKTSINGKNGSLDNLIVIDGDLSSPDEIKKEDIAVAPTKLATKLEIVWKKPESDSEIKEYIVQYKKETEEKYKTMIIKKVDDLLKTSASIDVTANVDYEVRVTGVSASMGAYSEVKADVRPLDISGMNPIAWLDANDPMNDGSRLLDNEKVAEVKNKFGTATAATQDEVENQPTYELNAIGGMPALKFEGNSSMEGTFLRLDGQAYTIMMVSKIDAENSSTRQAFLELYSENGTPEDKDDDIRSYFFTYGLNKPSNDYSLDDTQFNILTAIDAGTESSLSQNDVLVYENESNAQGSTAFTGNGSYVIGDDSTGDDNLDGSIAELMIFDKELSESDRDKLELYLNVKYSLEDQD